MNKIKKIIKNNINILIVILLISVIAVASVVIFRYCYGSGNQNHEIGVVIPILLYHDFVEKVPDTDPYDYAYMNTPEYLEENIRFLLDHGYTPISFKELYDAVQYKTQLPDRPIVITFDDGNIGQYTLAYPVLKKLNVKGAIFVVTDLVGTETDEAAYFGWAQALEMKESRLVEIYSHGSKHIFLNQIPVRDVRNQVRNSFFILDEQLGSNPLRVFAYPYGAISDQTVPALKNDGVQIQIYDIGVNMSDTINLSYVKRFNIPYSMEGQEILKLIESE